MNVTASDTNTASGRVFQLACGTEHVHSSPETLGLTKDGNGKGPGQGCLTARMVCA